MKTARQSGLTLLELLVAIGILSMVLLAVYQTVLASSRLNKRDQERVAVNRTLRGSLDLISDDIHLAGELLPKQAPALQISASPSVLTLYRGLSDVYLPLCGVASSTSTVIWVHGESSNPSSGTYSNGQSKLPKACSLDKTVAQPWEQVRSDSGKAALRVLLVDLTNGRSATFAFQGLYSAGSLRASGLTWKGGISQSTTADTRRPAPTSANPTPGTADVRLYLVEERVYSLSGGQLVLNVNNSGNVVVMPGAATFNVTARYNDPASSTGVSNAPLPFGAPFPAPVAGTTPPPQPPTWRDLRNVSVTIRRQEGNTFRELTDTLLPRNSISLDR